MSGNDSKINVAITAQYQNLLTGLDKSVVAVKSSTAEMGSQLAAFARSSGLAGVAFATFAGAVAAGAVAIAAGINIVTRGTEDIRMFAMQLGINTERATGLKDAIEDVGGSVDAFESVIRKLSLQLRTNEAGLNAMGLKTRDANGHMRDAEDLFFDAVGVMKQYREGTDQNIVANTLFGRSVRDVRELLRLQKSAVDESIEDMRALGLVVGQENVEANFRFIKASGDSKDVLDGLGKVLGQAVLPILSQLGEWFSSIGPAAVDSFRVAIAALFSPIYGLMGVLRELWVLGDIIFSSLGHMVSRTAEAFMQAARGDFAGAWKTLKDGSHDADVEVQKNLARMHEAAIKTAAEIKHLWSPKTTPIGGEDDGLAAPPPKGESAGSQFDVLRSKLEQWKEEQPSLLADLSAQELAYWRDALSSAQGNAELIRKIKHEIYVLEVSDAKRALNEELTSIKAKEVFVKDNYALRIRLAEDAANLIGASYGRESAEYRKSLTDIATLAMAERERQIRNAQEEVASEARHSATMLGIEESHINTMHALHRMSDAEQIGALQALNQREYQIELTALHDKLALLDVWSTAYGATLESIQQLEDKHQVAIAKSNDELMQSQAKTIEGYLTPITNAIEQSALGIAQGTTTMRKAMQGLLQSVEAQFLSMISKRVVSWLAGELAMTTATSVGAGARASIENAAGATSLLVKGARIIRNILAYAAETFAGVFANLSGLLGPFAAAPAAGAAATVAAVASSVVLSAEGGYDIPSGVNPMVQTHAREMILPASLAEPIREMIAGGGPSGMPTINIHAIDAKSVRALFMDHGSSLVEALKRQVRGFGTV